MALKNIDDPPYVTGYDINGDSPRAALQKKAIDSISDSPEEAVKNADIIFIAVPVREIVPLIEKIKNDVKPGAIVSDVGSTKAEIVGDTQRILPDGVSFIGGHPMTGSEITGIEGANADFFKDCYYVLTPTKETEIKQYEKLHALLAKIQAKVIALDPHNHDEIMSKVSHLPHAIAAALVNYTNMDEIEKQNLMLLSAGGFRDMTRIAASNPKIWTDIFATNNALIVRAIDGFIDNLKDLKAKIKKSSIEELADILSQAREARSKLTGETARDLRDMYYLQVFITDEPGSISKVTVAIGSKGVNIEDLELIHVVEGKKAILKCLVHGRDRAAEAAREIRGLGYKVQVIPVKQNG